MTHSSELARRWSTDDGRRLGDDVIAWISGLGARPAALTLFAGRDDLRGIRLEVPSRSGDIPSGAGSTLTILEGFVTVTGAAWKGLDLAGAVLPSMRFFGSTIEDCVFDGADCRDWRLWNSRVENSSFMGANLRDAALGTWHESRANTWQNVSFDDADLRGVLFFGAQIADCSFKNSKFRKAQFNQATIENSVFVGPMSDVRFDGRNVAGCPPNSGLRRVDFAGAQFADVLFWGYPFESVTLPPGVQAIGNYLDLAQRVRAQLEGDTSTFAGHLRAQIDHDLRLSGQRADAVAVYNRADFVVLGGEEFADYVEASLVRAGASLS